MRLGGRFAPWIACVAPLEDSSRVFSKNVALQGFLGSSLYFFVVHVAEHQASTGEKGGLLPKSSYCGGKDDFICT